MDDAYESCAGVYNLLAEPWLRPVKRQIVEDCLRLKASRVLDLGCGTGTLLRLLGERGIESVGLDLSPAMLGKARKISPASPLLALGKGEQLPFAARSFRGVVLSLMMHENPGPRRRAILDEAFRVLAPGGTLFILEHQKPSGLRGRIAAMAGYVMEWIAGKDHFRNYRQFTREGALQSFLAHIPPERIRWRPVFWGSMALAEVSI